MKNYYLSRRELFGPLAGAAAFLALHDRWAGRCWAGQVGNENCDVQASLSSIPIPAAPRIQLIKLLTAVPLDVMRRFYEETIGFDVASSDDQQLTIRTGQSQITFVAVDPSEFESAGNERDSEDFSAGRPFYHFAFNVPQNKILAARDWQRAKTKLVPTPDNLRDSKFPNDIRHFVNWNAHSVFFFDPAFNIVEYIARHDLDNGGDDPDHFSVDDILYISEIGFICAAEDRDSIAARVSHDLGLSEYPRGTTPWAIGDEHGLILILANLGRIWGENTDTPVRWGVFPTEATVSGPSSTTGTFGDHPYVVHSAEAQK